MSTQDVEMGKAEISPGIKVVKRIIPFEEGSPDQEPLFVNCFQVAEGGGVAYIDVGVIPLDEILAQPQTSVTFMVLTRLVMSLESLAELHEQITGVLGRKKDSHASTKG